MPFVGRDGCRIGSRWSGRSALALLGIASIGCSAPTSEYESDAEEGSVHAAVRVQNVTLPSGESRGDALAGFVRVPADADAAQALALAGLELQFPQKGECFSEAELASDPSSLSGVELLEAEEVTLESGQTTYELAPYAFPSVGDLLRGAVYLSRDRDTALPTGGSYTLLGSGINGEDRDFGLSATKQSPPPLSSVTVEGQVLSGALTLTPRRVLDLGWDSSEDPSDMIVVTVESDNDYWACSFSDAEEFGSIPLITDSGSELGQAGQDTIVSVHRVRSFAAGQQEDVDAVHVTFDFAVQASLSFDDSGADPQ